MDLSNVDEAKLRAELARREALKSMPEWRMLTNDNQRLRKALDHIRLLLTNAPGDTARREAIELAVHALGR